MDPYLLRNALTQDRGLESLEYDGHRITVNPVVLPHPARLTKEESLLTSGPGGLLGRQGFYVYRGDRLVVAGGWLGLPGMHNTAYTRLARIAVEIPPDADLTWMVDVRKSDGQSACARWRPGSPRSRRTYAPARSASSPTVVRRRQTRAEHRDVKPVWQQVRRLGRLEYTISREHPLIADALAGSSGPAIEGILKMIETTLPADLIGPPPPAAPPEDPEAETYEVEDVLQAFRTMLAGLPRRPRPAR